MRRPRRGYSGGVKLRDGISLVRQAFGDFFRDDAMTLGAALAFYTALSLAPLTVVVLWILSLLGYHDQKELMAEVVRIVGPEAGKSFSSILESANREPDLGNLAGILGLGVLVFSASGVFGQLQHSLDRIWNVEPRPGQGIRGWLRKRLLSLGMVGTIGFLLMASLIASALLSAFVGSFSSEDAPWLRVVDLAVPFLVYTMLFALIFKLLPDVKISWRDVWAGSLVTAALFTVGKSLIGIYLGKSTLASAYGAAGSLVVLLLWVYYSSLIVFFGAELTQARARLFGRGIVPDERAVAREAPEPKSPTLECPQPAGALPSRADQRAVTAAGRKSSE